MDCAPAHDSPQSPESLLEYPMRSPFRLFCSLIPSRRRPRATQLCLESLENRTVPAGSITTATTMIDYGADGSIDAGLVRVDTLDQRGHSLSTVQNLDYNADGIVDSSDAVTRSFDHRGRELTNVGTSDVNADGVPDASYVEMSVFDARGNVLSASLSFDFNADGVPEYNE